MSRVERSLSSSKEKMSSKEWALFFATLAGFLALSFGAVKSGVRKKVRDRASGKCEGCNTPIEKKNSIVGHLDSGYLDQPEKYSQRNNLRSHCPSCEAEWHLSHIGRAKDIGLNERDNGLSTLGRLVELAQYSEADFLKLCEKYQEIIAELFEKYDRDYVDFISLDERDKETTLKLDKEEEFSPLEAVLEPPAAELSSEAFLKV